MPLIYWACTKAMIEAAWAPAFKAWDNMVRRSIDQTFGTK